MKEMLRGAQISLPRPPTAHGGFRNLVTPSTARKEASSERVAQGVVCGVVS